jgi:hypothetical protein
MNEANAHPTPEATESELPTFLRVTRKEYERNRAMYLTYRVKTIDMFGWVHLVRDTHEAEAPKPAHEE